MIVFMYLNMGSNERKLNKIIGEVNGTCILQYAHVGKRYYDRVGRIEKVTGIEELKFHNIMKFTLKSIEKYYNRYITKNGRPVRNVIYVNFDVDCEGKKFNIEIAILVKSTKVTWGVGEQVVAEDYKEAIAEGKLKIGDIVIAIETIAATLKCKGERRVSFTEQTISDVIKLPKREYTVNKYDFNYMVNKLLAQRAMRTNKAYREYNNIIYT